MLKTKSMFLSPNLIFLGGSIWPQRGLTQEGEGTTNVGAQVHRSTPTTVWLARELEPNRKIPRGVSCPPIIHPSSSCVCWWVLVHCGCKMLHFGTL